MSETPNFWLLATAAIVIVISLIEAWTVSLIFYLRVKPLKKIFPSPHHLIRSHVDYCIMAGLLGLFYVATKELEIVLPGVIVFLTCLGAIYNPLPLILLAMKPAEKSKGRLSRTAGIILCIGFLPLTIGYGYIVLAIIEKTLL